MTALSGCIFHDVTNYQLLQNLVLPCLSFVQHSRATTSHFPFWIPGPTFTASSSTWTPGPSGASSASPSFTSTATKSCTKPSTTSRGWPRRRVSLLRRRRSPRRSKKTFRCRVRRRWRRWRTPRAGLAASCRVPEASTTSATLAFSILWCSAFLRRTPSSSSLTPIARTVRRSTCRLWPASPKCSVTTAAWVAAGKAKSSRS